MIDRALAEDLAEIFEVDVEQIPCEITEIMNFLLDYISKYADLEGLNSLRYRLQVVAGRLYDLMEKMTSSLES